MYPNPHSLSLSLLGWVALHEAAFRGHVDCCKMLLSLNAPLRPRTPSPVEDTPRELAMKYKQDKVISLLGKGWGYFSLSLSLTHTLSSSI